MVSFVTGVTAYPSVNFSYAAAKCFPNEVLPGLSAAFHVREVDHFLGKELFTCNFCSPFGEWLHWEQQHPIHSQAVSLILDLNQSIIACCVVIADWQVTCRGGCRDYFRGDAGMEHRSKTSMKELFGKGALKKDGTEGKVLQLCHSKPSLMGLCQAPNRLCNLSIK